MLGFLAIRAAVAAMGITYIHHSFNAAPVDTVSSSPFMKLNNPRGLSEEGGRRERMSNASSSNFTCPNTTANNIGCCTTNTAILDTDKACIDSLLGLACCVVSGSGSILGMIYMKEGVAVVDRTPMEKRLKFVGMKKGLWLGVFPMNWQWWWGFILLALLPLPFDGAALSFAPQSLIYPIGTATTVLVGQVVAPRLFFKTERLTHLELFGTFLIVAGAAVASAFGAHENQSYTVDMILVSGGRGGCWCLEWYPLRTRTHIHSCAPAHLLCARLGAPVTCPTNRTLCFPTYVAG